MTITDDDTAGFTITESNGTTEVGESGTTDNFDVVLDAQPLNDVVIDVSSGDTGEATVDKPMLTFTNANWDTPQTVTVMGADDPAVDGNQTTPVTLSVNVAQSDDAFDGLADQTVSVTTTDDDVQSYTGLTATGTGEATLSISDGTCALDPSNTAFISTEGLVLPPGVSFPDGAVRFRIVGCAPGATVEVALTLPGDLGGSAGWKLHETGAPFLIPGASVSRGTLIFSITDGGELDRDPAPGIIEDPAAAGQYAGGLVNAIPAWQEWARWLLVGLMLLLGWRMLGMRRRP